MAYVTNYYTADTHFGHRLMISPTIVRPRPFASTQEMDEFLIRAWNAVVRPDDLVYHLEDFSFGVHDKARVKSIFTRLAGRKILILGNHDYAGGIAVAAAIAELAWEQVTQQLLSTMRARRSSSRTTPSGRGPASGAAPGISSATVTRVWPQWGAAGMSVSIAPMSATRRSPSSSSPRA
ncbi:hypothetical protein [Pseudaminobacter sp. NGMCC 1.201702]|uniref:hypothetical protein n=1 Tax=Pseudaminobacter sp. NGMCC 1.201702 TaxID=3391825 RepID=UPI0039EE92BC